MTMPEQMLLATGGFIFHGLKQLYESVRRKESFNPKLVAIFIVMNLIAIPILVYVGDTLPHDLIVMSPLTCVIMGAFGSSMLAGFINTKKPKEVEDSV